MSRQPMILIIEPLTFTASKMELREKAIVFQSRFPQLASGGKFSSGNWVWVKPRERNVQKKKKKPRSKCQYVIIERHYRLT